MRPFRSGAVLAALLVLCAPAVNAEGVPGFTDSKITLLENRGMVMSEQDALQRISFRPFVPTPNYLEVALLPPIVGADKDDPQNRGIGYEYRSAGHTYVLREWPLMGTDLDRYPPVPPVGTCKTGHLTLGTPRYPRSYAWTSGDIAMALQPDIPSGANPNVPALKKEWLRLVKRGACR